MAKVDFESIVMPTRRAEERQLEWGIQTLRLGSSQVWSRAAFVDWLESMQQAGYVMHESEWHHSEFQPARNDTPALSVVSCLLHVTREPARIVVRADLKVVWTADSTPHSPRIQSVTVSNVQITKRDGGPVFAPIELPHAEAERARAQPLIVHDLDGDGLSELVIGESNMVYRNRGDGRFHAQNFLRYPKGTLVNGIIADFSRNGRPDYVSIGSDYHLYRFESDENGLFGSPGQRVCDIRFDRPQAFSAGDVDGDGDVDVAVYFRLVF